MNGWAWSGKRSAAHVTRLARWKATHSMHGLAVIPHHQIAEAPFMGMNKPALRRVLGQLANEVPGLGHLPADDSADMGREIDRLPPREGVLADQGVAHRGKGLFLLGGKFLEAKLTARMDQ